MLVLSTRFATAKNSRSVVFTCGCDVSSVWFYNTRNLQMSTTEHKRGASTEVVAELYSAFGFSLRLEPKEMVVGRCVSRRH